MEDIVNYFVIETQELIDLESGWHSIGSSTILADNAFKVLQKVSEIYCKHQYQHEILFMTDGEYHIIENH